MERARITPTGTPTGTPPDTPTGTPTGTHAPAWGDAVARVGTSTTSLPTRRQPVQPPRASEVRIERLILHQLDNTRGRLELVDEEVPLDARTAAFFAAHIASAAERADWHAAFVDAESEVPRLCRRLLAGSTEFVAASRQLALRLYDQMRTRPNLIAPGDFVVTVFRHGQSGRQPGQIDQPHVALLKLDPDEERLVREFRHHGARTIVRISAAENLLPETRRLQKCALLRATSDAGDAIGFEVTLLDTQAGPRSEGIAAFFYRGFLTAALAPSARRRTRLFLGATETWLSDQSTRFTPAQIFAFYRARRAALAGDEVRLAEFARAALPETLTNAAALRASLLAHLSIALFDGRLDAAGLDGREPHAAAFVVDRATADPVVRTVTLELDGGARLRVDARLFDALIDVAEWRTGERKIQLTLASLTLKEVTN
jgi:hypothetical protein